jgi:hypothetical protein
MQESEGFTLRFSIFSTQAVKESVDRQTDRQADRQTGRQADTETNIDWQRYIDR